MKPTYLQPESATRPATGVPSTFKQMAANAHSEDELSFIGDLQKDENAEVLEQHFRPLVERNVTRIILGAICDPENSKIFVATVAGRGSNGKKRTVLLQEMRLFGNRIVLADHLWLSYNRHWEAIEPFFQGCKVVLVGKVMEYTRTRDGSVDYTLDVEKITKLWDERLHESANNGGMT